MNKNQKLLTHAKAIDVAVVANAILAHWKEHSFELNQTLLRNLEELEVQNKSLQSSFGNLRKGAYTGDKIKANKEIANLFVGLKYLVKAYLHHPNAEIKASAKKVWNKIVAVGVDRHKQSLEKKISGMGTLTDRMLGELKKETDDLPEVDAYVLALKEAVGRLNNYYRLRIDELIIRKQNVQTTAQAHKVYRLLNEEIFPMLFTLCKLDPDNHGKLARIADLELKETNKKIRARRSMWAKRREEAKGL